jgi:site-specific recombinase XerD
MKRCLWRFKKDFLLHMMWSLECYDKGSNEEKEKTLCFRAIKNIYFFLARGRVKRKGTFLQVKKGKRKHRVPSFMTEHANTFSFEASCRRRKEISTRGAKKELLLHLFTKLLSTQKTCIINFFKY